MSYYDTIYTGGDSTATNKMTVHLYPFHYSDVFNSCGQDGDVADAIRGAGEELLNFGAIEYYEILRFKVGQYRSPYQIDPTGNVQADFKTYLNGRSVCEDCTCSGEDPEYYNGTCDDLLSLTGVHQLIHDDSTACDETAGDPAPAGVSAEGTGAWESAFETGLVAWSPFCSSNSGLTRNAAIQECLHLFIPREADDQWAEPDDEQHSLGKVHFTSNDIAPLATPMVTYHWDDNVDGGECPSESDTPGGHDQSLTECTKKAVRKTENTV